MKSKFSSPAGRPGNVDKFTTESAAPLGAQEVDKAPVSEGSPGTNSWLSILGEIGRDENRPQEIAWRFADSDGPIYLRSAGGDFLDGLTMANQIKQSGRIVAADYAGSAAVLLLTAGKRRILASNGWVMIHAGWTFAGGPASIIRQQVEHLERIDLAYAEWLINHSEADAETVRRWMAGETYLTATEALEAGLCDELGPPAKVPTRPDQSVRLAALRRQHDRAMTFSAPRSIPTESEITTTAECLAQYRAPGFDAVIDGGMPPSWSRSDPTASAASECATWTRQALRQHETQNRPLPEHPWPARWACTECGELNYHPPERSDGTTADCVHCIFRPVTRPVFRPVIRPILEPTQPPNDEVIEDEQDTDSPDSGQQDDE